jgi:predicted DNA-binding transcriptional regulator AlpA
MLLDTKDAAKELGISESLLKRWRTEGQGPRFITLGPRMIRYAPEDIQAYIDGLARYASTAEAHFQ